MDKQCKVNLIFPQWKWSCRTGWELETSRGAAVESYIQVGWRIGGMRQGRGKQNNAREMVVFFWYLFFWLPRIMGCVGSINASQTSVMNDLMFLFVIHWENERESCDLRPQQTAQSNQIKRGEKITDNSFDFTFLLPFLLCVSSTDQTSWHRVNGNNRSLWHDLWIDSSRKSQKSKIKAPRHNATIVCVCACVSCCNLCWLYSSSSVRVKK